jgi:hypothetical protein
MCGFSILDPRGFIGGFDRLRITFVQGDAGKWSIPDCRYRKAGSEGWAAAYKRGPSQLIAS